MALAPHPPMREKRTLRFWTSKQKGQDVCWAERGRQGGVGGRGGQPKKRPKVGRCCLLVTALRARRGFRQSCHTRGICGGNVVVDPLKDGSTKPPGLSKRQDQTSFTTCVEQDRRSKPKHPPKKKKSGSVCKCLWKG